MSDNLVTTENGAVGPMSVLTPMQQAFVERFCELGGRKGMAARAAMEAGYAKGSAATSGYRLLHDPKILNALRWHTETRFRAAAFMAMNVLEELAEAGPADTRLRAASAILDRAGMIIQKFSEHTVTVRHERTDRETAVYIAEQAKKLGLNAEALRTMLGPAAEAIIEGEFVEAGGSDADEAEIW